MENMILFLNAHFMCKIFRNSANVSSTDILHNDVDHEFLCTAILTGNILS